MTNGEPSHGILLQTRTAAQLCFGGEMDCRPVLRSGFRIVRAEQLQKPEGSFEERPGGVCSRTTHLAFGPRLMASRSLNLLYGVKLAGTAPNMLELSAIIFFKIKYTA